jgi:hypothetical protein
MDQDAGEDGDEDEDDEDDVEMEEKEEEEEECNSNKSKTVLSDRKEPGDVSDSSESSGARRGDLFAANTVDSEDGSKAQKETIKGEWSSFHDHAASLH